jgi:small subunit ribosomal protein S6
MHQYEIAIIYHPDLEIDIEKATDKVEKIFKDNGAKITKTDNWGKRKLAYKINKQDHGIYAFYTLDIAPEKVDKINEILRITDEVIRYLITKVDLKAIAKAEEAKAKRDKRAARDSGDTDTEAEDKDEEK